MEANYNTRNQLIYIAESAFDYFITILITGAFLASILKNIGVPDSVTGIITALTSFGFSAQLLSVLFIRPKSDVKKMIVTMNLINHLMFAVLYLIPYINFSHKVKIAAFAVMFLGGQLMLNAATPFKYTWFLSYIPVKDRGKFYANREIVSLVGGIVFSYVMGAVIDYYEASGNADFGFIASGIVLFCLSVIHFVSLLFVKDDDSLNRAETDNQKHSISQVLKCTLFDKYFCKIIILDVIWHIGTGISVSFFGSYQVNELGFSLRYVAILSAVHSLSRVAFSRLFGKIADKTSWARMVMISISVGAIGFLINSFTMPSNGKWLFAIYYSIYGIYLAGSNSGMTNIVFEYAPKENHTYAIGVKAALGGIAGFLASLFGAWVVSYVQSYGCNILGITVYAQQILSFMSFVIFSLAVIYIKKVILKMKRI